MSEQKRDYRKPEKHAHAAVELMKGLPICPTCHRETDLEPYKEWFFCRDQDACHRRETGQSKARLEAYWELVRALFSETLKQMGKNGWRDCSEGELQKARSTAHDLIEAALDQQRAAELAALRQKRAELQIVATEPNTADPKLVQVDDDQEQSGAPEAAGRSAEVLPAAS